MKARASGFTLIELMICVAILGLVMEVLPTLQRALYQLRALSQARVEALRSAQTLSVVLGRDIRGASGVAARYQGFSTSERCLVLQAPRVSAEGKPLQGAPDHIVYALDPASPGRLLKRVFPAPGSRRAATRQVVAADALSVRFTGGEGARLVGWEAVFGAASGRHRARRAFSGAAALRKAAL